jgi:hypothetical protein
LLQRQLDLFQRILADAGLPNQARLALSCRMLAQELRVLHQSALASEGSAS